MQCHKFYYTVHTEVYTPISCWHKPTLLTFVNSPLLLVTMTLAVIFMSHGQQWEPVATWLLWWLFQVCQAVACVMCSINMYCFYFQFDAEFRRFSVNREKLTKFDDFNHLVEVIHGLPNIPFVIAYTDPKDGDLLPINNDDNFVRALMIAGPLLRLLVQKKGVCGTLCNIRAVGTVVLVAL